jgi:ElaB/YqjD/DUF883 family membrane-anchored ribosome-binding protein
MINPNGEEFTQNNPTTGSGDAGQQQMGTGSQQQTTPGGTTTPSRFQGATEKVSTMAGDAWQQTRQTAGVARERTEFLLRENPVPTVIGALAIGLAIGLAIRYSSESREREVEAKTPFGDMNLGALSLPFLWPFFRQVRRRYEDTSEVVRDAAKDGMDRLRSVDVDDYVKPLRKNVVKPLRKQWRSWMN